MRGGTRTLEKARILILFPHMVTPGGALNYALHLTEQLLDQGAVVAVLTLRADQGAIGVATRIDAISLDGPLTSSMRFRIGSAS